MSCSSVSIHQDSIALIIWLIVDQKGPLPSLNGQCWKIGHHAYQSVPISVIHSPPADFLRMMQPSCRNILSTFQVSELGHPRNIPHRMPSGVPPDAGIGRSAKTPKASVGVDSNKPTSKRLLDDELYIPCFNIYVVFLLHKLRQPQDGHEAHRD